MFGLGIPEIIIILLAIGILLFGSKKITELARSMGRFTGEFKKSKHDIEEEIKSAETNVTQESSKDNKVKSEISSGASTERDNEGNNKV